MVTKKKSAPVIFEPPCTFHQGEGKAIPVQSWTGPEDSKTLRRTIPENRHMKVVSSRHWPPLPWKKCFWTNFCCRLCRFQAHRKEERIISTRNSSNTTRKPTRDLPASCAMPQPTVAPRFYQGNSWMLPRHVKHTWTHGGCLYILCSNQVNLFRFLDLTLELVAYPGILFAEGGVQQIQLRTERTGIWGR